MDANGFSLTIIVYVSSRSVDMRLPNQERFVSSGEASGVWLNSSAEKKKENVTFIQFLNLGKVWVKKQDTLKNWTVIKNPYFLLYPRETWWK